MKPTNTFIPAVIFLTISGAASANVILTANASPNPVSLNAPSVVTIVLSDNASSNSVAGFQFDVDFNPMVLQVSNITEAGYFANNGVIGLTTATINNTAGTITLVADAAGTPEEPGSGDPLVNILFHSIAAGVSPISIVNEIVSNSQGVSITDTTVDTNVTVTTSTPEPHNFLLLVGIGLMFMLPNGVRARIRSKYS